MPKPFVLRLGLLAVAAVVAAWFALGVIQSHDTSRAASVILSNDRLTDAEVKHVDSLLSAAGTLNPDRQVELLRGQLALRKGENRRALAIFAAVTHAEPQNVLAWDLIAEAGDTRALAKVARLEPKVR
jgi:predicted Zn-dependent protease